ncbi:hypothetical protein [Geomobilimonas luticola]|uniref:Uncharacterized protein n=1 Tax=Geomobilimonas luticola TaxID=1114878 RepID=A0ABS5SGW1_9BACT|nr:hypothetical protein [Geomobilimonas luticola]MBT0654598.1 hypothetical protein [Geomobilimonas luticola]
MKAVRYIAHVFAIMVILLTSPVSYAATATASLRVSVVIRPWVRLTSEQHIHSYRVTRADIEKGYIDLSKIATVNIRTNERKEQMILVSHEGEGVLAIGEGGIASAAGNGVVNMGMTQPGVLISKTIDGRILLPKDVAEGVYPLRLSLYTQ